MALAAFRPTSVLAPMLYAFTLFASLTAAQPSPTRAISPAVDARVELVSIAARLAGVRGFTGNLNPRYARAIDQHFASARTHPLVLRFRALKPQLDEAPWELSALAAHLNPPPDLSALVSIEDSSHADEWESRALFKREIVALVRRFYLESRADLFFHSQRAYYMAVEERFRLQRVSVDAQWVALYTGLRPTEEYFPIATLGAGEGAYMRVNFDAHKRHAITIIEGTAFDAEGLPLAPAREPILRSMLHETIHCYVNQLVDAREAQLRPIAESLLQIPFVANAVRGTFYDNWRYLLYESLVRAIAIRYLRDTRALLVTEEDEIQREERAGFVWMRGLVGELRAYEADRSAYPTLAHLVPRLSTILSRAAGRGSP